MRTRRPAFKFELFPLHSPLLGESLLVSFPPLIDMLKFSGYSYLIRGQPLEKNSWFNGYSRGDIKKREKKLLRSEFTSTPPISLRGRQVRRAPNTKQLGLKGRNDARTGMPTRILMGAMCVQRFDDSLNSAIHITYRISLRSSSMPEPRDPLLKVLTYYSNYSECL